MFCKALWFWTNRPLENWSHKVPIWEDQEENEEEWFVDPQKVGITNVEESDSDDDFVP